MKVHPALEQKVFGMAKELLKVTFAYAGFLDALECIKDLQQKGFSKDSPQYYPLMVGLICLYARPFTTSKGMASLSHDIVPAQFRDLHRELLRLRNEMFAHTDPAALLPGATESSEDFASGIVFRKQRKKVYVIPSRFHADPQFLPDFILHLLEALIEITDKKRKQLRFSKPGCRAHSSEMNRAWARD
jgi:hypothetical protein